jgi:hypothetical protein
MAQWRQASTAVGWQAAGHDGVDGKLLGSDRLGAHRLDAASSAER